MADFVEEVPQKKPRRFPWVLVSIISVLGIGAIVLPSSLNPAFSCADKAKESESRTYVSAMNPAQQAYFLENNAFTNYFAYLGLGIKNPTENDNYSIQTTKTASFHYGVSRKENLKSYVGAVFILPTTTVNKSEITTTAILCEALKPGSAKLNQPTMIKGVPTCAAGTKELNKQLSELSYGEITDFLEKSRL